MPFIRHYFQGVIKMRMVLSVTLLMAAVFLITTGCKKEPDLIDAYRAIPFQSGSFGVGAMNKQANSMEVDLMGGGTCMSATPAGKAVVKNGNIVIMVDVSKGAPPDCVDTVTLKYECTITKDQVMKVFRKEAPNIDNIECKEVND